MFINVGYKYPSVYSDELTDPIRYDRPTSTLTDTLILPVIAHLAIILSSSYSFHTPDIYFNLLIEWLFFSFFAHIKHKSNLIWQSWIEFIYCRDLKIKYLFWAHIIYFASPLIPRKNTIWLFFPFYSLLAFYCLETHYKSSNLTRSSAKVKSEYSAVKLSLQHINWLTLSPQSLLNLRQELYFNDGQLCCWSLPEAVSRSMGKLLFPSHPLKEKKGIDGIQLSNRKNKIAAEVTHLFHLYRMCNSRNVKDIYYVARF